MLAMWNPSNNKNFVICWLILIKLLSIFIPCHTIVYSGFTLDVLCVSVRPSVCILFPDDNFSKHQWSFTKLSLCNYIVEIWFGVANEQFMKFWRSSLPETPIFSFQDNNVSKHQWIFTKLRMCIDSVEIWFGIANGQIFSDFDMGRIPFV